MGIGLVLAWLGWVVLTAVQGRWHVAAALLAGPLHLALWLMLALGCEIGENMPDDFHARCAQGFQHLPSAGVALLATGAAMAVVTRRRWPLAAGVAWSLLPSLAAWGLFA